MNAPRATASARNGRKTTGLLSRDDLGWLAVAIVVTVVLRVAWVAYANADPDDGRFADSTFFHNAARLLAATGDYVDPYGLQSTAQWPPGYPIVLAIVYKLLGAHVELAKALNVVFAAVTVGATYLIARQAFDRRVAVVAALLVACFPGQIFFVTITLTETLFGMLFALVLLLALVWTVRQPEAQWWQVLLIGLLIGGAGLVRSEGVALVFVVVVAWALLVRPWRLVVAYSAMVALGTALALLPWTVRNIVQLDEVIILRANAEDVVARGLDPEATRARIFEPFRFGVRGGIEHTLTHPWELPVAATKRIKRLYENDSDGIRFVLRNQSAFGVVRVPDPAGGERMVIQQDPAYLREAVERPLLSEREQRFWRRLADSYFFAAGAGALVAAAVCLYQRRRGAVLLLVAIGGWTLLFGFIPPSPRFHFALGPLIAVFAAAFFVFAYDFLNERWGGRPGTTPEAGS